MSIIVTGDDVVLPVTLKKDGAVFTIDPGATIQAAIISEDRATVLVPPVSCLSTANGADWANSLVIVGFSSAETAVIVDLGPALVEIQVNDGGKLTWFCSVVVVQGTIA